MVRSLYAGISGLRSHQVALDVTGNNIANVNTYGFKAGRATFKESMAQMLQGPSRPAGNQGGRNPLQVGLGTAIGSIDTMLRQGSLQTTGQITDLALEGRAYFAFSSGSGMFYSRNGGLQLDSQGFLVSPTNGFRLQGRMADAHGNYNAKSVIGDLRVPWGEKSPAKATDEIAFACNLNSDSEGKGTVTHSNTFLANASTMRSVSASGSTLLISITDAAENSLSVGDALEITIGGTTSPLLTVNANTTLNDLRAALQTELGPGVEVGIGIDGRFEITNNSNSPTPSVTITGPAASGFSIYVPPVQMAVIEDIPGTVPVSFGTGLTSTSLLTAIPNVVAGDELTITVPGAPPVTTSLTVLATHEMSDLADSLETALGGAPDVTVSVSANGSLVIKNTTGTPIIGVTIASDNAAFPPKLIPTIPAQTTNVLTPGTGNTLSINAKSVNYLKNMTDTSGNKLNVGDILTIGGQTLVITESTTLEDLRVALQAELDPATPPTNAVVSVGLNGTLRINALAGGAGVPSLDITSSGSDFSVSVPGLTAGEVGVISLVDTLDRRTVLTNVFDEFGQNLGIKDGDTLKMTWSDSGEQFHFPVVKDKVTGELPTLEDLRQALQGYLNKITGGGVTVGYSSTGGFMIANNSGVPLNGLRISSDRAAKSSGYISTAFEFPPSIGVGGVASTPPLRIPANIDDKLSNVYNAAGEELGFEDGDPIAINGSVGSKAKKGDTVYNEDLTMGDLLIEMQRALGLPPTDGSVYERPTIEIKQEDLNGDGIPLGAIVIRGLPETDFAIKGLNVRASDDNHQIPSPTKFNTNMTFTEVQSARDTFQHPASLVVYDDAGAPHNVTMMFSHTGVPSEWMWEMSITGDEQILSGNRGKLIFGVDGTPAAFTFDDGSNGFSFEPMNGASQVSMKINVGVPGSKEGVTQFDSATTTVARDQNGYPMGKLQEISIGEGGEITGTYTNGTSKSIAQIYLAEFNNPAGLMKVGDSMFTESNNSGYATMYQPMVGTATKVKPGALEMSNVELETEFTNMITIQRGYQANARVITTSDSLLQELVQLVR